MNIIYAKYNMHHNSIDIYTYAEYFLRIYCAKAEEGLNKFIERQITQVVSTYKQALQHSL